MLYAKRKRISYIELIYTITILFFLTPHRKHQFEIFFVQCNCIFSYIVSVILHINA